MAIRTGGPLEGAACKEIQRAVVFKVNGLGDNVVFLPAFQALRSKLPGLKVTLLTTPGAAELYGGPLAPHAIITTQKESFNKAHRRPWRLASWIRLVRRMRPDACFLSYDQGSAAHLAARLSGASLRTGGNTAHLRVRSALTEEITQPADGAAATWNWKMAAAFSRSLGDNSDWGERPAAPDLTHLVSSNGDSGATRRRVVVHAGAAKALNQWPIERFASVATALSRDFDVVWIGHGATSARAPAGTREANVASLRELVGWLTGAALFLGNNSGPMHVANALGCQGVAVTGPSAFGWDPYWNRERWSVLRHPSLYCAPCEIVAREPSGCVNRESPMACMNYWTPESVEAACRARLSGIGTSSP
jgi:ADP-heptose:LPS heptosyltransferase